jgi:ADP-dependent NAD(P)H-hydrate dehydratase / NAD(P)H-hydrate epimerase
VSADSREPTVLDDAIVRGLLPTRDPRGHKGTSGKLLVVAGSIDYLGAALLTVRSACRAGAGLVRLAVPTSLQPLVAGRVLEAVTIGLPETDIVGEVDAAAALDQLLDLDHDAAVIGPGLRPGLSTVDLVVDFLAAEGERVPVVVDAEALNSLSTVEAWWDRVARPCVLTPHVGELTRLMAAAGDRFEAITADLATDDAARAATASRAAVAWGQVVVLKGARTVIAGGEPDPASIAVAPYENPALATAGTGDVLAGAIGALLAQGCPPIDAARAGVYLHGAAGEIARERFGLAGVVASDLPDEMARVRRRLELAAEQARSGRRLGFDVGAVRVTSPGRPAEEAGPAAGRPGPTSDLPGAAS